MRNKRYDEAKNVVKTLHGSSYNNNTFKEMMMMSSINENDG